MSTKDTLDLAEHFGDLDDPRYGPLHPLMDVVTIAILAVICGADDWVAMSVFGEARRAWLETFLQLPYGIPSHDCFRGPEPIRELFSILGTSHRGNHRWARPCDGRMTARMAKRL